ncbi:hypothetical protein V2O64_18235 [Verrucomicrobiaceae bacterium 227]
MKKLTRILAIALLAIPQAHADNDLWESKGPHVRIKRNDQDGSYVVFERTPDDKSLTKTTKDQNDRIKLQATYRRNSKGFLTTGQIHDGQGVLLWKVRYGYDAKTGLLIAEDMFDARVRRYYPPQFRNDDGTLKEMPIRRVYYFYDADGNQSKAISLVPNKGKTVQEVFPNNLQRRMSEEDRKHFTPDESFDPNSTTNPNDNPFDKDRKKQAPAGR